MAAAIDFYFDFTSPYGYLASTRINTLAAKYGRSVNWYPVLLGAVFKATGGQPLVAIPLKGPYSAHDILRTARFHKIELRFPEPFPVGTQHAARAFLVVQSEQGADAAQAFAQKLFQAYFVANRNIGELEQVLQVAAECGLDAAALAARVAEPAIKEALKVQTDGAMAKGVFGSPYVIVDGEPFWGFDRFDQLEAFLRDGRI